MATIRSRVPYTDTEEYTVIKGDTIQIRQERIIRTHKLSDFLDKLMSQGDQITPLLPSGCRFYQKKGQSSILIIEQAPKTRYVTWTGMHTTLSKWKLSFPYVVFILQTDVTSAGVVFTDNCKIFYRNSPILDQTDALCRVNTANVWDNHKICTGGSGGMRTTGNSLAEKAESYIAAFWQSQFNTDLLDHYHAAARKFPEVANLEAWQAKSAEDDTFPLRIEWDKVTTIAKIIKEIVES